jgi:hypothetical protein
MKFNYLILAISLLALNGCVTDSKKPAESQAVVAQTQSTSQTQSQVQNIQYTGTGTLVIKPIRFAKEIYVREAVKRECNLLGKLTQFVEENATGQYAKIVTDSISAPAGAQVLQIEIEQVQGGGGGAWSGGKMVLVNGKLIKRGKVIGTFKGRRYSGGGMFGAYKGTCAILGRCVKALGRDIAAWLVNPTHQAVLGDL